VHMAEVTQTENGDLLGHGVNVAARLQAEAIAGAILISEIVRDNVAPELAGKFAPRGRIKLAKMRTTIPVFAFAPSGDTTKARVAAKPILAVLAFDTPARDRATRTLADGVSEEI